MSRTLQFKRYPHSIVANTTGANGELIIDTTSQTLTIHDGSTAGGTRLATEAFAIAHSGGGGGGSGSNYDDANVAAYLPSYRGDMNLSSLSTRTLYSNTFLNAVSSSAVQFQYDPSGVYDFYAIANGNWFYLDTEGLVFQSNTNGQFDYVNYYANNTIVLGNDGNLYTSGNVNTNIVYANTVHFSSNSTITNENDYISITSKVNGVEINYAVDPIYTGVGAQHDNSYMYGANGSFNTNVVSSPTNVTVQTFDGSVYKTWTFSNDGNLTYPDGTYTNGSTMVSAGFDIKSSNDLFLRTAFGGAEKTWQFGTDAKLTFPDNSTYQNGVLKTYDMTYMVDANTAPILFRGGAEASLFVNYGTANLSGLYATSGGTIIYANEPLQSGWYFNNQGKIRFPDSSYQSTAFTGYATDNAAFLKANTSSNTATASFTKANTASNTATLAYTQANNAYNQANSVQTYLTSNVAILQGVDNTQNTNITTATNLAQAAFDKANTGVSTSTDSWARTQANGAFNKANTVQSSLSTVATSGSYLDLNNKPSIPTVPSNVGAFTNDVGYITNTSLIITTDIDLSSANQQFVATPIVNIVTGSASNGGALTYSSGTLTFNPANTDTVSSLAQAAYNQANTATSTIPQNGQSTNYTLTLVDAGKHIYSTNTSTQVITIPNNGTVSWTIGSTVMLVLQGSGKMNVIPATGVTMYLANNSTAKTYANVYSYGMATLLNVAANTWFINGAGVS